MSDEIDITAKTKADHAYAAAVVEFNLATLPLIVALTAKTLPSAVEVKRETIARLMVIEARRKAWAAYGQD